MDKHPFQDASSSKEESDADKQARLIAPSVSQVLPPKSGDQAAQTAQTVYSGRSRRPADDNAQQRRAADRQQPVSTGKLRICVVEDSYSALRTIFKALKTRGHEIDHFSTADDADVALQQVHYDALLMGQTIGAGTLAHTDLLQRVQRSRATAPTPVAVLVVAPGADAQQRDKWRRAGADEVLVTLSPQILHDTLMRVVANKKAAPPIPAPVGNRKVCLLEDSYTLSLSLCDALAKAGYDVDHYALPEEVLDALASEPYNILIADHSDRFGQFDFPQLLRHARAHRHAAVPLFIAALTRNGGQQNIKQLADAGADQVIVRDTDGDLIQVLLELLADVSRVGAQKKSKTAAARKTTVDVPQLPKRTVSPAEETATPLFQDAALVVPSTSSSSTLKTTRPSKIARVLKWIVTTIVFVVAIGGGGWFALQTVNGAATVEVVQAHQGSVARFVNGSGQVVAKRQVNVTASVSGQLLRVAVSEGDQVKAGDVIASLDNREAAVNLKRAEASVLRYNTEVAVAEKALKQFSLGPRDGTISKQIVTDLESALAEARAHIKLAEQEVQAAQLVVDRANITAPFAGVISQVFAVEGNWVEPRTPLFTLIDLTTQEIAVQLEAEDGRDISVGLSVTLTTDTTPPREWQEKVIRFHRDGGREDNGDGNGRVLVAFVSLGPDAPPLQYGQHVFAHIVTESSGTAIKVPFESVIYRDAKSFVAVIDQGKVLFKPVEIGVRALTEVEIVSGLNEGAYVVLPRQPLTDGQRVGSTTVIKAQPLDDEGFPFRADFADVAVYTTEQLRRNYGDAIIVDVRAKFEYDVVHIAKAINVPVAQDSFAQDLQTLRKKDDTTPLVFYCNGHSCVKSYEAARIAAGAGYGNVYAYDSGVFNWLNEARERTTLLGKTPALLSKLVSDDYFQGRLVDFDAFKKKAAARNALVIDIRDAMQRKTTMTLASTQIPLDEFVAQLDQRQYQNQQLLIFDAVGKQVRWLQYILEDRGYKDYFFLRDGIGSVRG